jgi:hypothetical protein
MENQKVSYETEPDRRGKGPKAVNSRSPSNRFSAHLPAQVEGRGPGTRPRLFRFRKQRRERLRRNGPFSLRSASTKSDPALSVKTGELRPQSRTEVIADENSIQIAEVLVAALAVSATALTPLAGLCAAPPMATATSPAGTPPRARGSYPQEQSSLAQTPLQAPPQTACGVRYRDNDAAAAASCSALPAPRSSPAPSQTNPPRDLRA